MSDTSNTITHTKINYGRLAKPYAILASQLIITALVVSYFRKHQVFITGWSLLFLFIFGFFLLYLMMKPYFSMFEKMMYFTMFSIVLGGLCIATLPIFSWRSIKTALISVLCIFVIMSIIGVMCHVFDIDLGPLSFVLFIGLLGLIVGMILSFWFKIEHKYLFGFGILIFTLLIATDTNRMLNRVYEDPVSDAVSLYLDIINLFQHLLSFKK